MLLLTFLVSSVLGATTTPTQRITGNLVVSGSTQMGNQEPTPVAGMVAYDKISNELTVYNGTAWQKIFDAANLSGTLPPGLIHCSDLADASASCSVNATNASNISSGTLPAARLPNPSSSTLGGVQSIATASNQFLTGISTSGVPSQAQPSFSNLSGNIAVNQMNSGTSASSSTYWRGDGTWSTVQALPTTTLGDTVSVDSTPVAVRVAGNTSTTKKFYSQTGNGTISALPTWSQPAFTDITGNISTSQMNSGTGASSSTFWRGDGTWAVAGGTITGPGSSTNTAFARWNGTGGTVLQDSVFTGASTGIMTTTGDTSGMTMVSVTDTTASGSIGIDHNSTSLLIKTLESSTNTGYNLGLSTASIAGANANGTGGITITTGSKTAGTGNSGGIGLTTGTTVGGTRGRITMADGSEVSDVGSVWVSSGNAGAGHWVRPSDTMNYIANPDASIQSSSTTPAGWANYADAAATTPVDCTGGAPATALTRNTTSPIGPGTDFRWTKSAANRQGEGFSYSFSIHSTDQGKIIKLGFDYSVASGTFVAGSSTTDSDMEVYVYDVTNAVLIQPTTYKLFTSTTSPPSAFESTFQANSNSTSYRLCVHTATTSASAYTLAFRNFEAKPAKYTYGSPATDYSTTQWTTSLNNLATNVTGYQSVSKRVSDSLQVTGSFAFSGVNTQNTSEGVLINMPSGFTIDGNKIGGTNRTAVGTWSYRKASTGAAFSGPVIISVGVLGNSTVQLFGIQPQNNLPTTIASSDSVGFTFMVPVTGMTGTVQMSDSAPQTAVSMSATAPSSGSITTGAWATVTGYSSVTDTTNSAFNSSTGVYTVQVPGWYTAAASVEIIGTGVAGAAEGLRLRVNGGAVAANLPRIATVNTAGAYSTSFAAMYLSAGATIDVQRYTDRTSATYTVAVVNSTFTVSRIGDNRTIGATEFVGASVNTASSTATTTNGIIKYTTVEYDYQGAYSTSTGLYTCPYPGVYRVTNYANMSSAAAAAKYTYLGVNGSTESKRLVTSLLAGGGSSASASVYCNAGQTLGIYSSDGTMTLNTGGSFAYTMFERIK